jgi:hypothetical protein
VKAEGKDSAREIREYFIPDFSEWKEHDKYKKAFERLLGEGERAKRGPSTTVGMTEWRGGEVPPLRSG